MKLLDWHFYRVEGLYDQSNYWGWWFRIYGYGLTFCNRPKSKALFSERHGYTKALYLFGVRIAILRADTAR